MTSKPTTIVFETGGNITGVGDVDDIALAGVHLALDLAAHSNDRDHVYGCAAAHEMLNGDAAHAVTTGALLYLVTEILEELYKATPNLEAFVRPELLKQAIAAGQQRMKTGGHHG